MAIDLFDVESGIGGFVIYGEQANDYSGRSLSSAGDVNGDGFDDLLIGAKFADGPNNTRNKAGDSYVVFGKAGTFAAQIDLVAVAAGIGGFVIHGEEAGDLSGHSVASAGDINGDGYDDLLIGALAGDGPGNTRDTAGGTYVVFGHGGPFAPSIDLAAVATGAGGFVIHGAEGGVIGQTNGDQSAWSVSSAGDINGDGFDDILIGAKFADGPNNTRSYAGDSYVIFGKAGGFAAEFDLATIGTGSPLQVPTGFVIWGEDGGTFGQTDSDQSGWSVSSARDINGDGFEDFAISAVGGDGSGNTRAGAGATYVLFGKAAGWGGPIDLRNITNSGPLAPAIGFVIHGAETFDGAAQSVASAGDVNGDGFSDLLIGATGADGPGNTRPYAGDTFVVFGHASPFPAEVDLGTVAAGVGGFVIHGEETQDRAGYSVSSAGDVNGDGFDDILIGAFRSRGPGNVRVSAGDSYVVFGQAGLGAPIDLVDVAAGIGGFVIHGKEVFDYSGFSVALAGDINGDGFDDLFIGAWKADGPGNTRSVAGDSYVLFGSATIDGSVNHVTHAGTAVSETLTGDSAANVMVGGRGDDILRGKGGADVMRGGEGNDVLQIKNANFARIVGGTGHDVLAFSGGMLMDDLAFRRISEIESIQLGTGNTNLTLGRRAALAIEGLASNAFAITIDASLATSASVTIDGSLLARGMTVDLSADGSAVKLTGGSGADTFTGGTVNDRLFGGAGNDTLTGGAGLDKLYGEGSNDTLIIRDGDLTAGERFEGGAGTDTLLGLVSSAQDLSVVTLVDLEELTGFTSGVSLTRSQLLAFIGTIDTGDITLTNSGTTNASGLVLLSQTVNLSGLGNNTFTLADSSSVAHVVNGGALNDSVTVVGAVGLGVAVDGAGGQDTLNGGAGDDILIGGAGRDFLAGGGGADLFVLLATSDSGVTGATCDQISGFAAGDRFDLSAIDADTFTGGNNGFTFIGGAGFSNSVGELRAFASGSNTFFAGDVNGDGIADFRVRVNGSHTLAAGDFIL